MIELQLMNNATLQKKQKKLVRKLHNLVFAEVSWTREKPPWRHLSSQSLGQVLYWQTKPTTSKIYSRKL